MTKQQFLDTLVYLADYQQDNYVNYGVGVHCYLSKIKNDAYQQEYGERVPSWDCQFFYEIRCKRVKHNTPFVALNFSPMCGDDVYSSYITWETYWIGLPAVSRYASFAADTRSRYTAGDNGVTIESLVTGKSYYIAYDDIAAIEGAAMQDDAKTRACTPPYIGARGYQGWDYVGSLGKTPAVEQMDLSQAVKRPHWGPGSFDIFR